MTNSRLQATGLDVVEAPALTHITACLTAIHDELQAAIDAGDLGAICNAADRLGQLQGVLWYGGIIPWEPAGQTASR